MIRSLHHLSTNRLVYRVCVCVIFAIHPRDIPRQRSLSPAIEWTIVILYLLYRCFIIYCWLLALANIGLGEKKRKITGSFVHVWPVYVYSKMDYYYYKYTAHWKRKRGTVSRSTGRTSAISIFSWTWNTTHTQTHGQPSSSSAYPKSQCVPAHESAATSTLVAPDSNRIRFRTISRCIRDRLSNTLILYNTF